MLENRYVYMFEQVLKRQDAIIDMLSSFMKIYAKNNNYAIEDVEEGCEYLNDIKDFDR